MTPIEFRTRRKALCLNQEEIGRCIALVSPVADGTDRPAIRQATIARWEGGRGLPEWADMEMLSIFHKIERVVQLMRDEVCAIGETQAAQAKQIGTILLPTYNTDKDFWTTRPQWKQWPAALWNLAALQSADMLVDRLCREVQLTERE